MSKYPSCFKVFHILPPVWLLNFGSDLSIDNLVRLGSADTRIGSQDSVKKVLEITEKKKKISEVNSSFFQNYVRNMKSHYNR